MLIAVIGGKLQGVEAVYLAQKAGWETIVIDKNPDTPATGLSDRFLKFEFTPGFPVPANCPDVDLIIPAVENTDTLFAVKKWARKKNIPLLFDLHAYRISCSKLQSDTLFRKMDLPAPKPWPDCSFPLVAKPDQASGSQGVEVFNDFKAFTIKFPDKQSMDNMVIQEYIAGDSYSIEVVGCPGNYHALQVTDLSMDTSYDCKRVTAPTKLLCQQIIRFKELSLDIAEKIKLEGIMDVEVILNNNELKLLEIDARLPSQTPIAVYWSSGINMIKMLAEQFSGKNLKEPEQKDVRFVVVEHIQVFEFDLEILGEHIMIQDGPLILIPDFFGCNEAITSYTTDYPTDKNQWVATMIFSNKSQEKVAAKRINCYKQICERFHLKFKD